ncbi:MAG: type II toxin-antitoxin system VapC family toxin [Candidatus Acidiferrum sp.]
MYLLDTTVWIDLIRTNSRSIRQKLSVHRKSTIGLSIITLCELQSGFERHAAMHPHLRSRDQHLLEQILASFEVYALDHGIVEIYGRLRNELESAGRAIGALDMFIAAQALSLSATLVTSNKKEFSRVPGLLVEDWR